MKAKHHYLFAAGRAAQCNAEELPEWIQLAPYGNHPTRDKQRVQVFNAEAAAQVVQWFDFWPRKVARLMGINAVPVWVGHPDFDPQTWPERRQIGVVKELEAREDGLWGRVAWNAEAIGAMRDEGHKFPSVAWDCDEINATEVQPAFLWSVGMWHRPNIQSVQPVINAAEDANAQTQTQPEPQPPTNTTMLDQIKAVLIQSGILKAEDSDETILDVLGSLISNLAWRRAEEKRQEEVASALKTAINATEDKPEEDLVNGVIAELNAARETLVERDAQIQEMGAQLTQINASRAEGALNHLIVTGRVSKAEEEAARVELNADFDKALAKYSERAVQLNTEALKLGKDKPGVMEAHERHNKLLDWCNARMTQTNCSWDEAWAASKQDAEMKGIHAAMESKAQG